MVIIMLNYICQYVQQLLYRKRQKEKIKCYYKNLDAICIKVFVFFGIFSSSISFVVNLW